MLVTAIELESFKGIAERVRVDLKPITLLFGANSAGETQDTRQETCRFFKKS